MAMAHESAKAESFKYWAFISYSSKDKNWSRWVHRAIDGYRPPRSLVGHSSADGPLPRRMEPVFRDREELAGAPSLNEEINRALRESRHLVVICSPAATASPWVNKEIAYFKSLGREHRVFCLIVKGEPNASASGDPASECFPPALRFRADKNAQLTDEPAEVPIAADARPDRDGKTNAKFKLLAGLLGVGYDDLRQREKRRTLYRRVQMTAMAAAVAVLVAFVWRWQAGVARQERTSRLTDYGLQELSQGHADRSLVYLSAAYSNGGDTPVIRFLLRETRLALPNVAVVNGGKEIFSARFSPDDAHVVTDGKDNAAKVYDAADGRLLSTMRCPDCVNSVVFSPDGSRIVTASDDGVARVWNAAAAGEPDPLAVLPHSPRRKIYPAVFSPDGSLIATAGSEDGLAKVWDAKGLGHEPVATFNGHLAGRMKQGIDTLEFSRDGTKIVTAGRRDNAARVWDPRTGRELSSPMVVPGVDGLRAASFSPDGQRVATCSWTGEAALWTSNGTLIRQLVPPIDGGKLWTRRVIFSPDGKQLVTVSADGFARVFDGNMGTPLFELPHANPTDEDKRVFAAAFSPDGRIVATAGGNAMVKLWDAQSGRQLSILAKHTGWVVGVEFSHDGSRLSTASYDGRAFIWDISNAQSPKLAASLPGGSPQPGGEAANPPRVLSGHTRYVAAARFSADGSRLVTIDAAGQARVWATTNGSLIAALPGNIAIKDATLNHDGSVLATCDEGGRVAIWAIAAGANPPSVRKVAEMNFPQEPRSIQFGAGEGEIIVAGEDGPDSGVSIFNVQTKAATATIRGFAVAISRDGGQIVTQDLANANAAWVWGADHGRKAELSSHDGPLICASFDLSGKRIVAATKGGSVVAWDAAGRELFPPRKGHLGNDLFWVGFSPNGRYIMSIASDNKANVWDAQTGKLLGPLRTLPGAETKYIKAQDKDFLPPTATFSPDSALVCTSSFERSVTIWDPATGSQLVRLPAHMGNVTIVAFSPVSNCLVTGALDGTARLWDLSYEKDGPAAVADFVRERLHEHLEGDELVADK
jgi:WD40 repeat protein